mmetsp:Transcript_23184/g.34006  ORF Transcript_23184/g.34006 Transcript_23184/m.34006 type:complete len:515 (+) Transcript_23184:107-1651(+)
MSRSRYSFADEYDEVDDNVYDGTVGGVGRGADRVMGDRSYKDTIDRRMPVFFNTDEMTHFPKYEDSALTFHSSRDVPFSPYRGYYADAHTVQKSINSEPAYNLINTYMSQSWASTPKTSYVETNAIRRNVTFKERMADKLYQRFCSRLCKRMFAEWYKFSFRYTIVRRRLLACFRMRYIARRFFEWRRVAVLGIKFRICLKRYWKRYRRLYFRWWKIVTHWEVMKLRLCRDVFDAMIVHTEYQLDITRKWVDVIQSYYRECNARVIQRSFLSYKLRVQYWATKTIKHLYMEYFAVWLIKRRRKEEMKRQEDEEDACKHMVERAHLYLRKLLQRGDGKGKLWTYLREVNDRWNDEENKPFVFPNKLDMPEIGMKWTVRGKAMHVLRHRTTFEVTEWARANFRESSPPLYVCSKCDETFLLRAIARAHKMKCQVQQDLPRYLSWKLCQPIVDAALGPLVSHFYEKKAEIDAAREEKAQIERMKSTALLNQALVGSPEKPRYDQVKTRQKRTELRVF